MKQCMYCGQENADDANICTKCGADIYSDRKLDALLEKNKQLERNVKEAKKLNISLPKIRPSTIRKVVLVIVIIGIAVGLIEIIKNRPTLDTDVQENEVTDSWSDDTPEPQVSSEYILPDSNSRYLTNADLEGLSAEQLRIARNEIYARHGRKFADAGLQAHFNSCSWYSGTVEPAAFTESMLNEYEVANRDLIVAYETAKGYR